MNPTSHNFNPYHKWLGIAPKDQPPNHYRLLGIDLFESDPDVISGAAEQRMAYVRSFQSGAHADLCERILDEIVAARVCLLRADLKAAYDGSLRQQMKVAAALSSDFIPPVGTITTRRRSSQTWKLQSMILVGVGAAIGSLVVGLILLPGNSKMPPAGQVPTPEIAETKTAAPSQASPASPVAAKAVPPQQAEQQNPSLPATATPPDRADTPPLAVAPFGTEKARSYQEQWAKHVGVPLEQVNSIGMKLVLIPAGEFQMGSTDEEIKRVLQEKDGKPWGVGYRDRIQSEAPRHHVRITKPFYLGVYEVTQAEYQRVMGKNPSYFSANGEGKAVMAGQDTSRFPVEQVSGDDAKEFCRRLSELQEEKKARRTYRLPTEAEWEYACRAGAETRYCFGDDPGGLPAYAWMAPYSVGQPHPVGCKRPNAWGLYDTHGNLWEWCGDWYHNQYYRQSPLHDPPGPRSGSLVMPNQADSGTSQVLRGGAWGSPNVDWLRCTARSPAESPAAGFRQFGFRVVCFIAPSKPTPPVPAKEQGAVKAEPEILSNAAPKPIDPNRAAAEIVFREKGELTLANGKTYRTMADLPAGEWTIQGIHIGKYDGHSSLTDDDMRIITGVREPERLLWFDIINAPEITDAGLENLATLRRLRALSLPGCKKLTIAGLRRISSFRELESLNVAATPGVEDVLKELSTLANLKTLAVGWNDRVTNTALEQFSSGFTSLEYLWIKHTPITDAGLEYLKRLNLLREVHADGTKITEAGVRRFNETRPDVEVILHEGGGAVSVGKPDDAQIVAAKMVFKHAGVVRVGGHNVAVGKLEDLPKGEFRIREVTIERGEDVTDDDLACLKQVRSLVLLNVMGTDAEKSKITDKAMPYVGHVRCLFLWTTHVTDDGYRHVGPLTQNLNIYPAQLTNASLLHLKELSNLKWTCIVSPRITDVGLRALSGHSIESISLLSPGLTDKAIENLYPLPNLKKIQIEQTKITDAGLKELHRFPKLEQLILTEVAGITDEGLRDLHSMKGLRRILVNCPQLSEEAISALRQALPQCEIREEARCNHKPQPPQHSREIATAAASSSEDKTARKEKETSPHPQIDKRKPDEDDTPPLAVAPFGAEKARSYQEQWAKRLGVPLEQANSIGMKLIFIPPGEFFMGSPTTEQGRRKDEYQHRVRITKPFYLGACEVTQAEYERVVGKNPSDFSKSGKQAEKVDGMDTSRFPVEQVSWEDAVEFCRRLSALPAEKAAGRVYRLPTEAEWEYACRAGTAGRFCFGDDVTAFGQYAWYEDNSDKRPHPVGEKKPNGWGLHDIHGSVFEWCQDWYDEGYYEKSPMDDPVGPSTGERRVLRGTCWHCYPQRCADRQAVLPSGRCNFWGFRVVCMQ